MKKLPLNTDVVNKLDPDIKNLLTELVKREMHFQSLNFYSGIVVDNNDPEQLGRCRIRVFGLHEDSIPDKALPWALPDDKFVGSFVGSMIIPPKEALVRVYFDKGDIYSPVYTTKIPEVGPDKKYKSRHISRDYPDTLLFFETDKGDYFTINKRRSEITFHSAGGAMIRIDNKGNISIDTTEADVLYGGGVKLEVNGDVQLKTVGDVTIDAVGDLSMPMPLINPIKPDPKDLKNPKVQSPSRNSLGSSGEVNLLSLGDFPVLQMEPIPDPTDVVGTKLYALKKSKKGAVNILTQKGDIYFNALTGNVKINATQDVEINAKKNVKIVGSGVSIGKGVAEKVLKSSAFASFFDAHIHAQLAVPPSVPMSANLTTLTSKTVDVA